MLPLAAEPKAAPSMASGIGDRLILVAIATAFALFHILTNGRYGFHRDELQVSQRRTPPRLGIRSISSVHALR
jgi:hypothetical protein